MTAHNGLRLLPWTTLDGNPCYLSTDDANSHLSRLADSTEATQLNQAAGLVSHALEVLNREEMGPEELRDLSTELVGALRDALRVATSRGHRLSPLLPYAQGGDDKPRLPAAAFG
ncbi:hypothetical protein [Streptomyces fradiae]|uniref:hypothetical protein n=1 Tax=Streptomyces fradiae TaxID=1906 RepID=UPI003513C612